ASAESIAHPQTPRAALAWNAYLESAVKAVVALAVSASPREVILSGRLAMVAGVREEFARRLSASVDTPVHVHRGFAADAKQAAQGAALIADGLAGGRFAPLVESLGIRDGSGTALDYLYVVDRAAARRRLGLD